MPSGSPAQMKGPQVLGPSSAAIPDTLVRGWTVSVVAGTQTDAHMAC